VDDVKVDTQERDEVLVVRLIGHLLLHDVSGVMAELATDLRSHRHHTVVCDLSELALPLTDWVLTAFPAALRRVGGWPACSLRLAAPQPLMRHRLQRLRMDRYLPVHPSVCDAVQQARLDAVIQPRVLSVEPDPAVLGSLRHVVKDLWPNPGGHGRDEAELVVDELAANVIKHVGRPFQVALAFLPAQALVAVTDPSREEPLARASPDGAQPGRGLRVVSELSQLWGVRLVLGEGKTVWATLPAAAPGATTAIPQTRSGAG
jgi:hypothetical protein